MTTIKKVWVFASGNGTNAEKLFEYFKGHHAQIRITGLFCNRPAAGVTEKARRAEIPVFTLTDAELEMPGNLLRLLRDQAVDEILLAGFLRKIPDDVVKAYADHIINVHPALLPKFGGKGMYGMRVHRAVKEAGETETGITVHLVNEHYDEGRILFQASVAVLPEDTPETIAEKVQRLEHLHYARACEQYIAP